MPTSKPKPRKPGRPRLVKAQARCNVVPVRFKDEDLKRIIGRQEPRTKLCPNGQGVSCLPLLRKEFRSLETTEEA
jgi:hypothetical protein